MLSFASSLNGDREAFAVFVNDKYRYRDKKNLLSKNVAQKISSFLSTLRAKENEELQRLQEIADVNELFKNPLHPYTKALMQSIPRLDKKEKRLQALKGMVPSITELGDGCKICSRFDPKDCACGGTGIEPDIFEHGDNHFVRCNPDIL